MKKASKFFLGAICAVTLLSITTGCDKDKDKDKDKQTEEIQATTLTVDATAYEKWIYVSFVEGKIVEISDYQNELSWDMALHRYDVRLNGGASGKGQGAALETAYTELSEATAIPESGYVLDAMDSIMLSAAMPPTYTPEPFNREASKWLNVNTTNMPPSYTPSEKVYIFKTAEGKHVKIKFIDYINAENIKGHIKFSYTYMD
ncbi:MAG: HmuY family protein [Bacteroidales bacterium]|jgi:hypothetical protein|nr:HmuY family protein [Bacteroidales bacterium]